MNLLNKIFVWAGFVSIAGVTILCALNIYWLVYPYKVSDYFVFAKSQNPIENKDHIICGGERIRWTVDSEILQKMTIETSRFIESRDEGCDFEILPTSTQVLEKGLRRYTNASYIVPIDFKPCTYHVRIVSYIKVNPIRTLHFVRETEDFVVK